MGWSLFAAEILWMALHDRSDPQGDGPRIALNGGARGPLRLVDRRPMKIKKERLQKLK